MKYTPIGSTIAEVKEFVRTRLKYAGRAPYEGGPAPGQYKWEGVRSLSAYLGEGGFLGGSDIYIHWAFDENGKLIDVVIEKAHDSL